MCSLAYHTLRQESKLQAEHSGVLSNESDISLKSLWILKESQYFTNIHMVANTTLNTTLNDANVAPYLLDV